MESGRKYFLQNGTYKKLRQTNHRVVKEQADLAQIKYKGTEKHQIGALGKQLCKKETRANRLAKMLKIKNSSRIIRKQFCTYNIHSLATTI